MLRNIPRYNTICDNSATILPNSISFNLSKGTMWLLLNDNISITADVFSRHSTLLRPLY